MGTERGVDFRLYLITDRRILAAERDLVDRVRFALAGGVRAVQLREKDLPEAAFLTLARQLRQLTRDHGARLLINGRIALALEIDADGVHLGGGAPPITEVRRRLGPAKLIGVSTHRVDEALQAAEAGADFVTFGPVYATPSKLPFGDPVGLSPLQKVCAASPIPVFALGGVTVSRLADLRQNGCRHVACIGAILGAADPQAAARAFRNALDLSD